MIISLLIAAECEPGHSWRGKSSRPRTFGKFGALIFPTPRKTTGWRRCPCSKQEFREFRGRVPFGDRLSGRHARVVLGIVGNRDPGLSRVAEQLHRRLQPARIVERAAHDQGHAGEALGLDCQHRAAAGAEAYSFLPPAITRVGEAVGRAVKRERFVWHRHDLDESRSALFLAVCAMASGGDLGLACSRVADVAAEAPAIHVRHVVFSHDKA